MNALALLLFGCGAGTLDADTGTTPGTTTSTTSTSTTTSTATTTGTTTGTTTSTTSTVPTEAPVSGVSWALHPDYVTLVKVSWTQDEAVDSCHLQFSVDKGEWMESPPVAPCDAGAHEQWLFGVPEEWEVVFRVVNVVRGTPVPSAQDWNATTGAIPDKFPLPTITVSDPAAYFPARWILGSLNDNDGGWTGGTYWTFIMDRKGRVVWVRKTPDKKWTLYPRISRDGTHFLIDENTYWSTFDGGEDSILQRLTLDGEIFATYGLPGLHHSWDELPDTTIVWGSVQGQGEELRVQKPDLTQYMLWDSETWMDAIGQTRGSVQSNTVNWEDRNNSVLFSFYTNDTVVEVAMADGATLRQWGEWPGSYAFDPADSQFRWQHGTNYTDDGHLLLSTHPEDNRTKEQRAREYYVDDANQTLVEVWSYGEGTKKFAPTAGEIYLLSNGNRLMNYGGDAGIREIDANDQIVWDADWDSDYLVGHTTLLDDLYALNVGWP